MDDFFTFLQLFVIFMISSGVAITAVVFPHYPLGLELFSKAFVFRGLMALFSSEMSDLKTQHQPCTINATSQVEEIYSKKNKFKFYVLFLKMIIFMHIINMEFHHRNAINHHG
jgi:hypothetical protein